MKCPNCSYENEGGNFCIKCGAKLVGTENEETAASVDVQTSIVGQANSGLNLENTKQIVTHYFKFFSEVLKNPYATSKHIGEEHFVNAIITFVLYCVIIPLTIFFGLKTLMGVNVFGVDLSFAPKFSQVFFKLLFSLIIFTLLLVILTFSAVRMGKITVSYQEVFSRFGAFLIPFVAILLLSFIFSVIKIKLFMIIFLFGFLASIFLVPPLVIVSYYKDSRNGLDVVYGSLLTYILNLIFLTIFGRMVVHSIVSKISDLINSFDF